MREESNAEKEPWNLLLRRLESVISYFLFNLILLLAFTLGPALSISGSSSSFSFTFLLFLPVPQKLFLRPLAFQLLSMGKVDTAGLQDQGAATSYMPPWSPPSRRGTEMVVLREPYTGLTLLIFPLKPDYLYPMYYKNRTIS